MTHHTDSLFGWYSAAQAAAWGAFVYLDDRGAEVRVTGVTPARDPRPDWPDAEYVGPVTQFLRNDPTDLAAESAAAPWARGALESAPPSTPAAALPRAVAAAPGLAYGNGRVIRDDVSAGMNSPGPRRTAGERR